MTTKRHRKKIARELPPVGTSLQGRFKGETRTATIVEAQDLPAGKAIAYEGNGNGHHDRSLEGLIDLYLLRCQVEGKSLNTTHAYAETLRRFLHIAREEGLSEDVARILSSRLTSTPTWAGSPLSLRRPATATSGRYAVSSTGSSQRATFARIPFVPCETSD